MTFFASNSIDWDLELMQMRHVRTQPCGELHNATGFDADVLDVLHKEIRFLSPHDCLKMMTYIHQGPTPCNFSALVGSSYNHTLTSLHAHFELAASVLRTRMNSTIRYEHDNHSPFFPDRVTAIFDTLPIRISSNADGLDRTAFWSGKHECAAIEFGTVTDQRGRLLEVTGPFRPALGVIPHLVASGVYRNRRPAELFIGDQAYQAVPQFLTVVRPHDADKVLSAAERNFNHALCSVRSRVEHVNQNCFHRHKLFQKEIRLSLEHITNIIAVIAFAEHVRLRLHPPGPAFGAWPYNVTLLPELWQDLLDAASVCNGNDVGDSSDSEARDLTLD